jgi:hypothetical protein
VKTGFLTLITHPAHPGLVSARIFEEPPELVTLEDGSDIRYVARFKDGEAALMHVQNSMHAKLVDLENRIYRNSLINMIATVEADGLDHQQVWIDPAISTEDLRQIDALTRKKRVSIRRIDRIWQIAGFLGLLLLLLVSLL